MFSILIVSMAVNP